MPCRACDICARNFKCSVQCCLVAARARCYLNRHAPDATCLRFQPVVFSVVRQCGNERFERLFIGPTRGQKLTERGKALRACTGVNRPAECLLCFRITVHSNKRQASQVIEGSYPLLQFALILAGLLTGVDQTGPLLLERRERRVGKLQRYTKSDIKTHKGSGDPVVTSRPAPGVEVHQDCAYLYDPIENLTTWPAALVALPEGFVNQLIGLQRQRYFIKNEKVSFPCRLEALLPAFEDLQLLFKWCLAGLPEIFVVHVEMGHTRAQLAAFGSLFETGQPGNLRSSFTQLLVTHCQKVATAGVGLRPMLGSFRFSGDCGSQRLL